VLDDDLMPKKKDLTMNNAPANTNATVNANSTRSRPLFRVQQSPALMPSKYAVNSPLCHSKLSACAMSVCLAIAATSLPSFNAHAANGLKGGVVVGGSGVITQDDKLTTITQASQNMAINWNSYNVKFDEQVNYIQPNASSLS